MAGSQQVKVAAVQHAPVLLDRDATVERACGLIAEAAGEGARLVVFPETFLPGYPAWVWRVPASEFDLLAELQARLVEEAVEVPGEATGRLCAAAAEAGVHVAIGIHEPVPGSSGGSLYNSTLMLGPDGSILGVHRKLVPTAAERLVWAPGDGSSLQVHDTPLGVIGGLICWENYMPLARFALYAQGVQIWLAPTWDHGDTWLATLRHIAKEGGLWVIGCGSAMRADDIPKELGLSRFFPDPGEWVNDGDSAIVDPLGNIVAGPAHRSRQILYADIEPSAGQGARWKLDVAGHYARPDIFELIVHDEPRPMVRHAEVADAAWKSAAEDLEEDDVLAGADGLDEDD